MGDKVDDYDYTEDEISAMAEQYAFDDAENRRKRALFLHVFDTEAGREVLKSIRDDICRVGASCFDENPINMARRAGRQEAAFAIDEILAVARIEAEEDVSGN